MHEDFSFHSVLQELFVVFLGALLGVWISYSHPLTEEEFIPRVWGMCGERCGKRDGVGGRDLGTRERENEKKLICDLVVAMRIPVLCVVGQAKRRTGGSR